MRRFVAISTAISSAVWLTIGLPSVGDELPAPTRWTCIGADCDYRVDLHDVADRPDADGAPVERFEVRAGAGTYVYARRPVSESLVIEDLQLGVWIQSDRRGIQVLARVLFPEAIDPQTGRPAEILVPGQLYHRIGFWQKLVVTDITKKTQRQLRVLRARAEFPVNARGAYVDAMVVNLLGGPGTTRVSIGEIETEGRVEPQQVTQGKTFTQPSPAATDEDPSFALTVPTLQLETMIVDGQPFFPRVIDHHGEPFELLAELGFNTVFLPKAADAQQLAAAMEHRLWLVSPPPADEVLMLNEARPVLAWYCGQNLSVERGQTHTLDQLRRKDPHRRPIVAGVQDRQWLASRQIDVLVRERLPLGTSFELARFGPWLQETTRLARPGTPFWSVVQTELSPAILEQLAGAPRSRDRAVPRRVQAHQVRQLALASVSAGARGLWFRSDRRLDADDEDATYRRLALQRVNLELALVAPWIMGGQQLGEVASHNPDLRVVALSTDRSRLLIPNRAHRFGQYVTTFPRHGNSLVVAGVPDSTDVFLLTATGLHSVRHRRISGGIRIDLDAGQADSIVLMTQDPLIVSYVNQVATEQRRRAAELQLELAELDLKDIREQADEGNSKDVAIQRRVREARAILQAAHRLLESGDATDAFGYAHEADVVLSQLKRDVWEDRVAKHPGYQGHPTTASFALLSWLDDELVPGLDRPGKAVSAHFAGNLLEAGTCENLLGMVRAGWRQYQTSPDDVRTYVALSTLKAHSGERSLRLRVQPQSEEAQGSVVETPPVWINSAPVTVYSGDWVRVRGWVRIDKPIEGGADGCMISDSVGGPELGVRIYRTKGWEPFEMIRRVDRDDHLTVTVALTGAGEVWFDDLSVTRLTSEIARRQ